MKQTLTPIVVGTISVACMISGVALLLAGDALPVLPDPDSDNLFLRPQLQLLGPALIIFGISCALAILGQQKSPAKNSSALLARLK